MKEWQNEADQWRLPYWDFAKFANRAPASATLPKDSQLAAPGELRLPILLVKPNVEIRSVSKNTKGPPAFKTVSNPFYKYTAPKLMGSLDNPYKIVTETREDKKNKTKWTIPVGFFLIFFFLVSLPACLYIHMDMNMTDQITSVGQMHLHHQVRPSRRLPRRHLGRRRPELASVQPSPKRTCMEPQAGEPKAPGHGAAANCAVHGLATASANGGSC